MPNDKDNLDLRIFLDEMALMRNPKANLRPGAVLLPPPNNIRVEQAWQNWLDNMGPDVRVPQVEQNFIIKKENVVKNFHIEWGGADIDPSFYDMPRSDLCGASYKEKDKQTFDRIQECMDKGIPIIGICRGAQALNVANGGILVQHIFGHTKSHNIDLFDLNGNVTHTNIKVSSTHHQMMIAHESGIILGKDPRETNGVHWDRVNELYDYKYVTEVVYYPDTKSLCIQPHPEWMAPNEPFVEWINDFIGKHMGLAPINFRNEEYLFHGYK